MIEELNSKNSKAHKNVELIDCDKYISKLFDKNINLTDIEAYHKLLDKLFSKKQVKIVYYYEILLITFSDYHTIVDLERSLDNYVSEYPNSEYSHNCFYDYLSFSC